MSAVSFVTTAVVYQVLYIVTMAEVLRVTVILDSCYRKEVFTLRGIGQAAAAAATPALWIWEYCWRGANTYSATEKENGGGNEIHLGNFPDS